MTDAEKKMKNYVNAVEWRLNLPHDVKVRVMADFTSSIQARREAGCTDEEIYTELGKPKKAAADLNEQMKEFAYRKSPWRWLFAAMAVYGAVELLGGVWVNLYYLWLRLWAQFTPNEFDTVSFGVIGGADGPTAIFLTAPVWTSYLKLILLLAVGIWGFRKLSRCRQK